MTNLLDSIVSRTGLKADRSERYVALARAAIVWERVWPALWPATGIVGAYVAAALLGLFAVIPVALHSLLLFVAVAATAFALYIGFRTFQLPRWQEAARRVERDSTLAHRPLTEADDRLLVGAGNLWAEALWRAHVKRLLNGLARLRVALPSPGLPARDPYAIRYGVLLLLIASFAVAGGDWNRRLALAFTPLSNQGTVAAQLDAWINPPEYTGEAPIYLQHGEIQTVAVPVGSELAVRVHSADVLPALSLDPRPSGVAPQFRGASGEFGAGTRLNQDSVVSVREAGHLLGRWHIKTIPDNPPVIAFAEPPSKTERNAIKFAFTAGDDYGVVSARALIRPVRASAKSHTMLVVDLPLSSTSAKTVSQAVYRDLTGEPLAGLEVEITLEARDGAGQTGLSKPVRFWLPARVFANPLARALIEQRQNLAIAEPHARERVARVLDALTIAPEHFYASQPNIYLSLRTAYWSLMTGHTADDVARVQGLLWQTAVALEDSGVLSAAEQLRQLQQLLSQALAQGAPQNVIDALLDRYRQALQRYMQALAQNAPQSGGAVPPNAKVLRAEDLEAMLKAIQQMAQTGSRAKAQEMLAMLQGLLENLHINGTTAGQGGPGDKAMSDAIQGLGDLMGRQRQLLDKSYRQGQGAGDPHDGGGKGLAEQQGQLRDDLDKVTKGLGAQHLPQAGPLGDAERHMSEAQNELGSGAFDGAGTAQKSALDAMRQASNALAQELMKRNGQGRNGEQGNDDPLGRAAGSHSVDGGNVKIPDQSELARARSILEELRKRASQQGRPKEELDYIDRLLREF
jgi:uncharacterized protein (TIGR02302 family)